MKKGVKVFNFLRNKFYSIICLQETHSVKNIEKIWKSQWRGQILFSHGDSNARGCAILIKKRVDTQIYRVKKDTDGRYLIVEMSVNGTKYVFANLYAPNFDSPEFFVRVFTEIQAFENPNVIILGDFNTVLNNFDKKGSDTGIQHPKAVEVINTYCESFGLLDIWRERNKDVFKFTWYRTKPRIMQERIDIILVSATLSNDVILTDIDPRFLSDHAIPHITLKSDVYDSGHGYWKMNVNILEDAEFIKQAINCIRDVI